MSPPIRRLLLAWGAMAALTLAAIFVGHAGTRQPLGPALVIALLTLSFVKSAILLAEYLDLRHAPGWNSGCCSFTPMPPSVRVGARNTPIALSSRSRPSSRWVSPAIF